MRPEDIYVVSKWLEMKGEIDSFAPRKIILEKGGDLYRFFESKEVTNRDSFAFFQSVFTLDIAHRVFSQPTLAFQYPKQHFDDIDKGIYYKHFSIKSLISEYIALYLTECAGEKHTMADYHHFRVICATIATYLREMNGKGMPSSELIDFDSFLSGDQAHLFLQRLLSKKTSVPSFLSYDMASKTYQLCNELCISYFRTQEKDIFKEYNDFFLTSELSPILEQESKDSEEKRSKQSAQAAASISPSPAAAAAAASVPLPQTPQPSVGAAVTPSFAGAVKSEPALEVKFPASEVGSAGLFSKPASLQIIAAIVATIPDFKDEQEKQTIINNLHIAWDKKLLGSAPETQLRTMKIMAVKLFFKDSKCIEALETKLFTLDQINGLKESTIKLLLTSCWMTCLKAKVITMEDINQANGGPIPLANLIVKARAEYVKLGPLTASAGMNYSNFQHCD